MISSSSSSPIPVTNALSIDVEDWFQVSAFSPYISRARWDVLPCRVERNVDLLLDILANGPNPMARSQAAGMLVMPDRKDPRIYDALVKAVADPETEPSSRAISALGKLGDQRAAPLLLPLSQEPPLGVLTALLGAPFLVRIARRMAP